MFKEESIIKEIEDQYIRKAMEYEKLYPNETWEDIYKSIEEDEQYNDYIDYDGKITIVQIDHTLLGSRQYLE